MKNVAFMSSFLFLVSAVPLYAEGLDTLIAIGKSQAEMQKALDEETKAFERVKRAVETGDISKGQGKAGIRDKYGEPVVATQDSTTGKEKWVYLPATSSFFKGAKMYLFFDTNGLLDEIRLIES